MAEPKPEPIPSSITDEQREIAKLLCDLGGHVYADRFWDFCRLTNGDARKDMQLRAALPLAAHAIRELESTLRTVLREPFGRSPEEKARIKTEAERLEAGRAALLEVGFSQTYVGRAVKSLAKRQPEAIKLEAAEEALRKLGFEGSLIDKALKELRQPRHAEEIKRICANMGLGADGGVSKNWQKLSREQARWVHLRSFHLSATIDEEFRREMARPFQAVLRDVTLAYQRKYHVFVLRVDELAGQSDKAGAVVQFKNEIFGAITLQRRFYQAIEGMDWLDHLAKEGLLGAPVPNFDDEDAGVIRNNEWPPFYYLLKVAKSEDVWARKKLVQNLSELGDAEDYGLREKCFEIARTLPAPEAAALADTAVKWLRPRFFWTLHGPEQYLSYLIGGGEGAAVLVVARALLGVNGDDGTIITKYDRSDYGHSMLPLVEPITKLCGVDGLNLFCDFLEQAGRGRQLIKIDPAADLTSLSSSMSDEDQARYDVYSALVVAVRRSANGLVQGDKTMAPDVLKALMARGYDVYKRIALEAGSFAPDEVASEAIALLKDPRLCGQGWCAASYGALARAAFPKLSQEDKQFILDLVRSVPQQALPRWVEYRTQMDGKEPTPEMRQTFLDVSLRDAVWYWRDALPDGLQKEIQGIVEKEGLPSWEDPRFSWEGFRDESPASAEEIVGKPADQLVEFLKTWKPADGETGLTISALGMELRKAVDLDPQRFSAAAESFDGVGPHYIRRLLEGLDNQVRNGKAIDWQPVLRLIAKLLMRAQQPVPADVVAEGEDPRWSWVLMAAADVIRAGLYRGNARIPEDQKDEAWAQIRALHQMAPGIVPDDFQSRLSEDAYFAARSTLEGAALEAAILFGWWSREIEDRDEAEPVHVLPDAVRAILDSALARDEGAEPGLRAIIGRYFDVLLYLDPEWASLRSDALFGPSVSAARRELMWEGHLLHGGLSRETWLYFHDDFEKEAELVGTEGYNADYRGRRFIEYLIFLYQVGDIELGSDGVVAKFLAHASVSLRETATWAITRDLQKTDAQLPAERRARLHRYYEERVEAAKQSSHRQDFRRELGMVGIWLGKSSIDNTWTLQQLQKIAGLKLTPPHLSGLFDWLESLLPDEVDDVITTIELVLLDDGFEKWMFDAAIAQVGRILTVGSTSLNPVTRDRVKNCANILVSRGNIGPVLLGLAK